MENLDNKNKLLVLTLVDQEYFEKFKKLESSWDKYFFVEQKFDKPANIKNYLNHQVGILFLQSNYLEHFKLEYYGIFQKNFPNFLYVVVEEERTEQDIKIYKSLADQILFLNASWEILKWNSIAIIRRYWNTFSKPTTIIYKSLIADFIERKVHINNQEIILTTKEFEILKVLVENKGKFIQKNQLFFMVWGYDYDTTRVVDQIIFKLKSKIGKDFFQIKRTDGIKFE